MRKNKKSKQSGFGLVEVLVSISLLTLVVVTFNQLSLFAFRNWENAQNKSIAYNLIQSTIEDLHNIRSENLNNSDNVIIWSSGTLSSTGATPSTTTSKQTVNNKEYTITTTVVNIDTQLNGANGIVDLTDSKKKVSVKVDWSERNGPKSLTGVTYLTDWKGKY